MKHYSITIQGNCMCVWGKGQLLTYHKMRQKTSRQYMVQLSETGQEECKKSILLKARESIYRFIHSTPEFKLV